jgi:hypothetical protein
MRDKEKEISIISEKDKIQDYSSRKTKKAGLYKRFLERLDKAFKDTCMT